MHDKILGKLVKTADDDPLDGYSATLDTSHGPITLRILLYGTAIQDTLPLVHAFVASKDQFFDSARELLISDFLPMHNEGFFDEGEFPLSEEEFLQKAGNPDISIDLDGEIQFTYGHEELLWGHWMGISFHPDGSSDTGVSG